MISREELREYFQSTKNLPDIYEIRCFSLDQKLSHVEFARLMLHLAQRRGFQSNRKNEDEKEMGLLLSAVEANKERMKENQYRTIGEMLLKDPEFSDCKRNKKGNYRNTVARSMMVEEINHIFEAQRNLGSSFATEIFQEKYLSIFLSQRTFEEGPGGDSPYAGNQIEKMVGRCTFGEKEIEKAESAKFTYLKGYHAMRKALDSLEKNYIRHIREEKRDEIATIFTYYKTDTTIQEKLEEFGFSSQGIRKGKGGEGSATFKGMLPYFCQGIRKGKGTEGSAMLKGSVPYFCDRIRNGNGCEGSTAFKDFLSYLCERIGKGDGF